MGYFMTFAMLIGTWAAGLIVFGLLAGKNGSRTIGVIICSVVVVAAIVLVFASDNWRYAVIMAGIIAAYVQSVDIFAATEKKAHEIGEEYREQQEANRQKEEEKNAARRQQDIEKKKLEQALSYEKNRNKKN